MCPWFDSARRHYFRNLITHNSGVPKLKKSGESDELKVSIIIFLRQDIFDFIKSQAPEPDKLTIRSYHIDWQEYSQLLKKMIEKRFKYTLNLETQSEIDGVWDEYFEIEKKGRSPFEVILGIVSIRPRDVIYFMTKLFESAVNSDKPKIDKECFDYATKAYTAFLNENLIAEVSAEFPDIRKILRDLYVNVGQSIPYPTFKKVLHQYNYDQVKIDSLLNALFQKNYMLAVIVNRGLIIDNLEDLKISLKETKYMFYKKNEVILIPSAEELILRDTRFKNLKKL